MRIVLALAALLGVMLIAVLVSVERRLAAMETAFADATQERGRCEPEARSQRTTQSSVVHAEAPPLDLARIEEACGAHAAEVAAAICDGTGGAPVAHDESAAQAPARDEAVVARARAEADELVARARASGRWSVASRDRMREVLGQLPRDDVFNIQGRVLAMLNDGSVRPDQFMSPL